MNKLIVPAQTENLEKVLKFIDIQLGDLDDDMQKFQLELAIEEAYVNIARYAYDKGEGDVLITSDVEKDPLQITIQFIDSGMPYNPLKNQDPDISLKTEDKKIGGLGIFLIKKNVDDIGYEYHDGKNILTLKKKLMA